MNELKTLKNLLLGILAGDDESQSTKIKAIQTLKIDQEINVPIVINQYQSINVNIRQNLVKAINLIDEMAGNPLGLPVDIYSVIHKYQHKLIDTAMERTGGNKSAAAKLLGIKRTSLVHMIDRHKKGMPLKNIPYKEG